MVFFPAFLQLQTELQKQMIQEAILTDDNITKDILPLKGTDYIELYVGNAKQSAHYYEKVFGFKIVAYAGPETGVREKASYLIEQGKIRFLLTSALFPDSDIARQVLKHGDGVKTLALWVDDATKSYHETVSKPTAIPFTLSWKEAAIMESLCLTSGRLKVFLFPAMWVCSTLTTASAM
jgi:4-hydroxyphenylpyruvate dioxygenase-like putative hemolysin